MKPIPSTPETRRVALIANFANRVANPVPGRKPTSDDRLRAVVALGLDATRDQIVAAQVGWAFPTDPDAGEECDGCGLTVARLVRAGEEEHIESATAALCRACLVEALAALDAAP